MNLSRNGLIILISVIFVAGAGTAYAGMVLPMITLAGDVTITGDTEFDGKLLDTNDDAGTSGQVLSSTESGVDWVDPADIASLTSRIENLEVNQGNIVDYVENQLCARQNVINSVLNDGICQVRNALNNVCNILMLGNCAGSCSSPSLLSCNVNLMFP